MSHSKLTPEGLIGCNNIYVLLTPFDRSVKLPLSQQGDVLPMTSIHFPFHFRLSGEAEEVHLPSNLFAQTPGPILSNFVIIIYI